VPDEHLQEIKRIPELIIHQRLDRELPDRLTWMRTVREEYERGFRVEKDELTDFERRLEAMIREAGPGAILAHLRKYYPKIVR
jgi:hypothetical protein